MGDRNAYVDGRSTRFALDARRVRFGEREAGRPDLGASANFSLGLAQAKRLRHFLTVRSLTPRNLATSMAATPSANMSKALARFTIRCSALAGRSADSTRCRSFRASASGTVGRPGCARSTNGE
jgi:hypothetical protein